jgi:hypothetical protein
MRIKYKKAPIITEICDDMDLPSLLAYPNPAIIFRADAIAPKLKLSNGELRDHITRLTQFELMRLTELLFPSLGSCKYASGIRERDGRGQGWHSDSASFEGKFNTHYQLDCPEGYRTVRAAHVIRKLDGYNKPVLDPALIYDGTAFTSKISCGDITIWQEREKPVLNHDSCFTGHSVVGPGNYRYAEVG